MLALLLTSSARASVANLSPNTTPGYVAKFDTRLALTNSPLYAPSLDTVDMYSATTTNRVTVNGGGYLNTVTNSGSQTLSLFSGGVASTLNLWGGGGSRIVADAGNGFVTLNGFMGASSGFALNPTAGVGSVPFLFNSLTNHPGDFIFEVDYAGAAQMKVKQASGYAGGGTKALTDDGTYKIFTPGPLLGRPGEFTGFEVYDNFERTNGPLGTALSGHVWDVRGKAIGAGIPLPASTNGVIRNGRMISDDYSIVYAVAYMQSTATRVGGVARFYPGVGGVSEGAFGMISGSNVTNTISDSVHVSVWSTGWELDIYDNYVFTTLASGAHTLATNGMPHIIELYIDGNTATLRIDDDIHQAIESRVSTKSGNVVYWENYYATTNALTSIEIDECWAGSSAIRKWHGELYSDINTSSVAVDSGGYYLFNLGWYGATDQEYMRIIPVTDRYWFQSANTGIGVIRGIQLYTSGPNLWAHPNGGVTIGSLTIVPPGLGLTVNGTINAVGNNQIRVFEDGDTSGTTNRWFREVYTAGTAYLQSSGQLANNGAPIDLNIDGSSKVYASTNAGVGIGTNGCPNGISLYVPGRILARNATLYDLTVDNGGITNSGNYMMTGAGTALIYPIAGGGIGFETDVPGLPKYWNLNPDGSTILPGTLSAAGITNAGTILLTATGQTLLYQLPSGGFALATDIGGSPKYWAFNQDGSTLLPGTLSANGITNAGAYWLTLGGTGLVYSLNHPGGGVGISVNYGGGPNERDWAFETNGITTFPGAITVNQDNGSVSIFNNSTAPGTPSFTIGMGLANLQMNGFGSIDPISTYGLFSQNLFYSTASQAQNSPTVTWSGSGWGTNSATSQPVVFGAYVIPISGLDTPSGDWVMERIISNTAPVRVFSIRTDSGWTGAGTRLFTDNGKFLPFASIPGLINPTSGYVPYNNAGNPADSWFYYTANGMKTDTNFYTGSIVSSGEVKATNGFYYQFEVAGR